MQDVIRHLLLLCASLTALARADEPPVAFTNARIIDGTGAAPREHSTLVIQGDRILSVGEAPPAGAKTVDLAGQTIIPGLISAHSHVGQVKGAATGTEECFTRENVAAQLAQYERYGVTAILSLGMNKDVLYTWRDEQRAGQLPGADLFTADRGIGVPASAPPVKDPNPVYRPKNPEEARAAVRETAARHPDALKLWVDDFFGSVPKMAPAVYRAVIEEAHAQHLRVAAHLFYLADAKALVADGLDIIAHSVRDQLVDEELIAAMRTHGTLYIPTLALDESQYIYAGHPAWMDTPFFTRAVPAELLGKWLSPEYAAKMRVDPKTPRNKAAAAIGQQNVKLLFDAGIPIAMGTDSGALPTRIAGFGEHRELQLLVQAGLSPMEALVCATRNSARVLGQERERGTLEPGKRADFVILSANPLEDIVNTGRIEAVWHGGKPCGKP